MAREERTIGRKNRVPLGGFRKKLTLDGYNIPSDKVAYWFNDHPGRIHDAQMAGFAFVSDPFAKVGEGAENERDKNAQYVSRIVGTSRTGGALKSYLMIADRDTVAEDYKATQEKINAIEKGYKTGNDAFGTVGQDGRFVPPQGINFKEG